VRHASTADEGEIRWNNFFLIKPVILLRNFLWNSLQKETKRTCYGIGISKKIKITRQFARTFKSLATISIETKRLARKN
jgi:hypothetical protein